MTFLDLKTSAETMGVSISYAVDCRVRDLKGQIAMLADIEEGIDAPCPVTKSLAWKEVSRNALCIHMHKQEIRRLTMTQRGKVDKNEITPDMIERAKLYPIELLVEFTRGKARCFSHEEKTASLSHDKKRNQAHCFGSCGKSWDSIAVLMDRDGVPFPDAVRQLQ